MTSEKSDTNEGDTSPKSETNEHDYAHAVAGNSSSVTHAQVSFTTPAESDTIPPEQSTLQVELPEPAVGAEVDCLGGHDVEASSQQETTGDPQRSTGDPQRSAAPHLSGSAAGSRTTGTRRRNPVRRPEDRNCGSCKCEFERQGRSFNRRAVYTFTTPETVHWVFPETTVHDKSFLCETCAQVIRSKCKRKQSTKRSLWLKPPVTQQSKLKDKRKNDRRMGKKSKAALLVSKSCYKAALKMLWSAKGARKPMMEFWRKQLKEEMKALTRHTDSPFQEKVSSKKPLSSFPWRRCLDWAQEKAPLVSTCLTSLFPDINALSKSGHQLSEEQAQTLLERRTVVALSIPLFTRNVWKNNFLQAALGAELRLQGCTSSALEALNTMGLCQNKDTVRLLLHRLRNSKKSSQNGGQRMKMQIKGEQMADVVEEDIEEDEEEEEEDEDEEDEDEEEEEEEEQEIEMAVEEEVEEAEVQDDVPMEEDEDQAAAAEEEKKRKRKKAKKQKKEEKRKERGKRKVKEREEAEQQEEEDDEGSEQKKRRVVVVRLGLLKGHSEVGRSDLSAP
ncbi:DNA ligase 1-like [Labrus mixtus]|uniref:DNA ligase 1-like n=1 Tax=Labrus mixtus TaxID=508554 RepID=UPI0029C0549A|nr:DNA ligase 1-like [Labrus mixtus]